MAGTEEPGEGHRELDTKIMRSSAWAVLGFGGTNVLALVTTAVLARFLVPEEFGVVTLATALIAVAHLAQESGMGAALVVHRGDMAKALATATVYSPAVGIVLSGITVGAAPLLERAFATDGLSPVLQGMAASLLLRGITVAPLALLEREMRFGPITAVDLAGGIAQTAVSIGLAVGGAGVWALVGGQIAFAGAQAAVAIGAAPVRPRLRDADWSTFRSMSAFGRHVAIANVVSYGNQNAERIVTGRMLGTGPLGYYGIVARLAALPDRTIGNILGRGVFPAMARLRDDEQGFRRVWLENVQRLALLSVPTTIGVIVLAEPLILTMLGDDWRAAIVPLQILAASGLVRAYAMTGGEVFMAKERPRYRIVNEVAYLVLIIPSLIVGAHFGELEGVAIGVAATNVVVSMGVLATVMRLTRTSLSTFLAAIAPAAVGWAVLAATLLLLRGLLLDALPSWAALVLLVLAGASAYLVTVWLVARDIVVTMWTSLRGRPV